MINFIYKDNKIYAPLAELKNWEDNPKEISSERFQQLKDSLFQEGQLMPILVDMRPEHEGEILGGNMTYRALTDLQKTEAWVEPKTPMDDAHAFELAMKHNMMYGRYLESELQELANRYKEKIDLDKLAVPSAPEISLAKLLENVSPTPEDTDICPQCLQKIRKKQNG